MSKGSKMTIRIEELEQAEFNAAAKLNNRPSSQVVRELMRQYVEETKKKFQIENIIENEAK